jgi:hypothetical protein
VPPDFGKESYQAEGDCGNNILVYIAYKTLKPNVCGGLVESPVSLVHSKDFVWNQNGACYSKPMFQFDANDASITRLDIYRCESSDPTTCHAKVDEVQGSAGNWALMDRDDWGVAVFNG